MEAQDAVLEGREALGKSAQFSNTAGIGLLLLALVLESTDFDDLVRNVSYLNAIMQYQSDEIAAQKERTERFNALVSTLNVQKSDQKPSSKSWRRSAPKPNRWFPRRRRSWTTRVPKRRRVWPPLERPRRIWLRRSRQAEAPSTRTRTPWTARGRPGRLGGQPNDPEPPDSGDRVRNDADSSVGWSTGIALGLRRLDGPVHPNPGITATGDVCDDWSMGVAVPMAWPNYRSYFGRTVEISYNGMTVFATVNDCGNMGGGSRALDLQPGVWKAFGFSSCNAWGLRTVSYRFL
ncbi:MAG: hypothetical protein ACLSVD_11345 [Eggerthellaceae bacterium]